jgi:hypothetical protein
MPSFTTNCPSFARRSALAICGNPKTRKYFGSLNKNIWFGQKNNTANQSHVSSILKRNEFSIPIPPGPESYFIYNPDPERYYFFQSRSRIPADPSFKIIKYLFKPLQCICQKDKTPSFYGIY